MFALPSAFTRPLARFFSAAAAAAPAAAPVVPEGQQLLRLLKPVQRPAVQRGSNRALTAVAVQRALKAKNVADRVNVNKALDARVAALPPTVDVQHSVPASTPSSALRFAVIAISGTQHRVCVNDLVMTDRLHDEVGDELTFSPLLVGSQSQTQIGRPTVQNVIVKAKIEEHLDGAKVIVFKKKRRTGYKRTTGFRAQHSVVRITAIDDL